VIASLQESLSKEQYKTKDLEAKMVVNNQLLSKIYGDLAKSLNNGTSPNGVKLNGSNGTTNGTNGSGSVNGTSGITVDRNGLNMSGQQHS
jgi:hypothetical protein